VGQPVFLLTFLLGDTVRQAVVTREDLTQIR
jgi:hypothetical protein